MKSLLVSLVLMIIVFSCKKEIIVDSIKIEEFKIIDSTNLSVSLSYRLIKTGNPEIVEHGIIFTSNSNPEIFNQRIKNSNLVDELISFNFSKLESDFKYYIRPYVITNKDTILGETKSFTSKSYFKNGIGVYDIDNNYYPTVILGQQEWMGENLKTTKFSNGDLITKLDTFPTQVIEYPAWCNYDFDNGNDSIFGKFYNGYTLIDIRDVCPSGFHVPTNDDWLTLFNYLGNDKFVGGKLKSTGTLEENNGIWNYPNYKATNASGLNFLPGGVFYGYFFNYKNDISHFSIINTENPIDQMTQAISLGSNSSKYQLLGGNLKSFTYLRCVKD